MTRPGTVVNDLLASLVVFLVAVPLCLGIAIACGLPPAAGLISGILGGVLVGSLAGCPLQVTGPAAGLITLSWDISQRFGVEGLGAAILIGGALQAEIGAAGMGGWFRAVSPAIIQGMLSGIGAVILGSQFHVMLDQAPKAGALANYAAIPAALAGLLGDAAAPGPRQAAILGALTIATVMAWAKLARGRLALIPGTLLGALAATALARAAGFEVRFVPVPDDFFGSLVPLGSSALAKFAQPGVWIAGLTVAFVASAETLLTAAAVDRMSPGSRTKYDKEVIAQGVGNLASGFLGGLPLTGVIVRSAANVQAGARTRLSAVLHGVWILLFVAILPGALKLIPISCLAAILVFTGVKLLNPAAAASLYRRGPWEFAEFCATAGVIVAKDLLTGIIAGFLVALARIVWTFSRLDIETRKGADGAWEVELHGAGHFLLLPKLGRALESIPDDEPARVDASGLLYADHAVLELLDGWRKTREAGGKPARVDWGGEPPTKARTRRDGAKA